MGYFKHFLVYIWLLQITAETIIKNRQINTDIDLSCNGPEGNRRWFYKQTDNSLLVPITSENGSHYEIQTNIAGLRIFNSVESDEGIYIVQGDGGVECKFILNIFGMFSYNSGVKNPTTGNYEQTIEVINNYAATVDCSYNITGVSDAISTFVNVDAVVENTNVEDCTENEYPFCSNCKSCFPKVNNAFRHFIVYPKMDFGSTTIVCRVNLGTNYNGQTVDKHVTFTRTTVSADSYVVPYNSTYQLCSNTPGDKTGVILTTEFSEGIPVNQIAYSIDELPSLIIKMELSVSCQNLDSHTFPNIEETYLYNIKLSAIPDLTNTRLDETISVSNCGADSMEVKQTFNCGYELFGNSEGQQQQQKKSVIWELDGNSCSVGICSISGDYSELNTMDIRELGNETEYYSLKCYVELNGVQYYQEWSLYLMFEVCATNTTIITTTTTTTTTITTPTTMDTTTVVINTTPTVIPPDPASNTGVIVGITVGVLFCIIFLIIVIILIVIAVVIVYFQFSPYKNIYYTRNLQNVNKSGNRIFNKLKGNKEYSRQSENANQGDITITV